MELGWRGLGAIVGVLAGVAALAVLDLRCSGKPDPASPVARVANDIRAGRQAQREQQAENLTLLARDLRQLAARYEAKGEKLKAHRARAAALELDKKIKALWNAR